MFPFGFGAKEDRGTGFSVLVAREMEREPKNERGGRGMVRKEGRKQANKQKMQRKLARRLR